VVESSPFTVEALSRQRLALLPDLLQLLLLLPRQGTATANLQVLCGLPEAAQLDSSAVVGLLEAALQVSSRCSGCWW
jgi:hypothetical protein